MKMISIIYSQNIKKNEIANIMIEKFDCRYLKTYRSTIFLVDSIREVTVKILSHKVEILYNKFEDIEKVIDELAGFNCSNKVFVKVYDEEEKINTIRVLDKHNCIFA